MFNNELEKGTDRPFLVDLKLMLFDKLKFELNMGGGDSQFTSTVALIKTEMGGEQQCRWFTTLDVKNRLLVHLRAAVNKYLHM